MKDRVDSDALRFFAVIAERWLRLPFDQVMTELAYVFHLGVRLSRLR